MAVAWGLAALGGLVVAATLACYMLWPPLAPRGLAGAHACDRRLGALLYATAYLLSLLRAPLGLAPYLLKVILILVLRVRYEAAHSTYRREVVNMAGDALNLAGTALFLIALVGPPRMRLAVLLLYLPIGAELLRLSAERIPITVSALWQLMPHRRLARALAPRPLPKNVIGRSLGSYRRYYALDDAQRGRYVLRALKRHARDDADLSRRLTYMRAFRVVPRSHSLRGGQVRDVAAGEVFIHDLWTNDPWLLIGMAIRRAPWIFDPRYLRRPFYYMSEANRLATRAVLDHARYCPPYTLFQFGHEIRVARLHFFYSLLRRAGLDSEEKVGADGAFEFDQIIHWLERRLGRQADPAQRPMYTDDEAIGGVLRRDAAGETTTPDDVARRYTYPMPYVEQVLWPTIIAAREAHDHDLATNHETSAVG